MKYSAVIFDMDGVIVDTEKFWTKAEEEVFSSLGVILDDKSCQLTRTMTTREVTEFWFSKFPWKGKNHQEVEQMVIDRVIEFIKTEDCAIDGIKSTIDKLKFMGLKIGLATNSPSEVIPAVLAKLELNDSFDFTWSAEFEKYGKPHPDVYLAVSKNLGEPAHKCIAIEDSESGIQAAKKAGMVAVGFTNSGRNNDLVSADYLIDDYSSLDWGELTKHVN